jgi:inner membrane transporter RhtA
VARAALAGVLLMAANGRPHHWTLNGLGVLCALLNAGSWGTYIVLSARSGRQAGSINALAVASVIAAALWLPVALIARGPATIAHERPLLLGAVVGALATGVPYMLENLALRRLPRPLFATFASLEPAVAGLIGLLFLAQALTPWLVLGMACAIAASVGASLPTQAVVSSTSADTVTSRSISADGG